MIKGKKIAVVLPAYNAAATLEKTYNEIPFEIVDEVVLVDDNSRDETIAKAKELGIKHIIKHEVNRGYGGNQKSCYTKALSIGGLFLEWYIVCESIVRRGRARRLAERILGCFLRGLRNRDRLGGRSRGDIANDRP